MAKNHINAKRMERHAKQILEIYHEHIKICIKGKSSVCRTAQGEDRYKHNDQGEHQPA